MSATSGVIIPESAGTAAYPSIPLLALTGMEDVTITHPRVTSATRSTYSDQVRFRPYRFGHSDLSLRPAVPQGC